MLSVELALAESKKKRPDELATLEMAKRELDLEFPHPISKSTDAVKKGPLA